MIILRLLILLLLVAGGGLGYLALKYETSDPCAALQHAIVEEAPETLEERARGRFGDRIGGRLAEAADRVLGTDAGDAVVAEAAALELEDKGPMQCVSLLIQREFDPEGFRETIAERLKERLSGDAANG